MDLDFDKINETLRHASAAEVVAWAVGLGRKTIATTKEFNAAVEAIPTGKPILAYVLRDGSRVFVAFNKP